MTPTLIDPPTPGCPKRMVFGPCGGVRGDGSCELDAGLPCPWCDPSGPAAIRSWPEPRRRRPGPGPGAGRAHRPHRPALRPAGHARDPRDARAGVRRPAHRRGPALPRLPADHDRGGDPRRRRRPVDHPDLPRPQPRRARAGARGARRARRRRGPLRHRRRAGPGRATRDHPGVRPRQHPPRAPGRDRGRPRRRRRRPGRPARRAPRRGARGEAAGRRHPRRRQPRRVAGGPRRPSSPRRATPAPTCP